MDTPSPQTAHRLRIRVVGIPRATHALTSTPPNNRSLINGGANICITNNLSTLTATVPVTPFPISMATTGTPPAMNDCCTVKGLLTLPLDDGTSFLQPCYYCPNATETIISPDAILESSDILDTWTQIGRKGDAPGSIQFSGPSPNDTFTLALTKRGGLYYLPTEDTIVATHTPLAARTSSVVDLTQVKPP